MNVAYNMDCMVAMKQYPDKYFDLAVVDPPYGIKESGEKAKSRGGKYKHIYHTFCDDNSPPKEYFDELIRISKNQIIFGANHFISKIPYDSHCWIVWDKDNGDTDFADCELAYTSFKSAVRKFKFKWQGMCQENMKEKEIRIHPTQKPVALYTWIFSKYAKPGNKVIDTHLGSGSSRIAAFYAGLDFVGYEIDKTFFDLQQERFENVTSQTRLF